MRFGIREIIFLAVLLAVPLASFVYVFQPQKDAIDVARAEMSSKLDDLDLLKNFEEDMDAIREQIVKGEEAVNMLEDQLPTEKDVYMILEQITSIVKEQRLVMAKFETEDSVPAATYQEKPIRLMIDGPFEGFYQFLTELEALPRITRIRDLKIERHDGKGNGPSGQFPDGWMRAELALSIYYQPSNGSKPSSVALGSSD